AVNEYFCKRENNPLENKILELFKKLDEKEY
ncbi:histidine kinase, partial [Campylobacter jejuni]|nr:histidine kinase [Campylobacter jejuni]